VLHVVLPIEPAVNEEAKPSYRLSLEEPPINPVPFESALLGLVLGGSTRPLPSEDPRDLSLPFVHAKAMLLKFGVHFVQQRTCFPLEFGLGREVDDPAAVADVGDPRREFLEGDG